MSTFFVFLFILFLIGLLYNIQKDRRIAQRSSLLENQHPIIFPTKNIQTFETFSQQWHVTLLQYVPFYKNLSTEQQIYFQQKVLQFLQQVELFAIDFELTPQDYLFVATSAVLPIFGLRNWMYPQLKKIILHQHTLGTFEDNDGDILHTAGYVNFSTSPTTIHLARNVLWHDFVHDTPSQVAIHEFMHFIDYTDKWIDGIPQILIEKKYIEPWVKLMFVEMQHILNNNSSVNEYASENRAEFLATVTEFYFKQPSIFKQQHPHLFVFLNTIFNTKQSTLQ